MLKCFISLSNIIVTHTVTLYLLKSGFLCFAVSELLYFSKLLKSSKQCPIMSPSPMFSVNLMSQTPCLCRKRQSPLKHNKLWKNISTKNICQLFSLVVLFMLLSWLVLELIITVRCGCYYSFMEPLQESRARHLNTQPNHLYHQVHLQHDQWERSSDTICEGLK